MESEQAIDILLKIYKVEKELEQLEKEYRKLCSCNIKIREYDKSDKNFYKQKIYKTCKRHSFTVTRDTQHHAAI